MARTQPIKVEGLAELQRELRRIGPESARELRLANKAAAEIVAGEARSRALVVGGVAAKSAPSIRPLGQGRAAAVKLGGARYPFALGAEFGSIQYRQFAPWTGSNSGSGYFLYPAIRAKQDDVVDVYDDMLRALTKRAFPK